MIVEIALGIVLGVILLVLLPFVLIAGFYAIALALPIAAIGVGIWFAVELYHEDPTSALLILAGITLFAITYFAVYWALGWNERRTQNPYKEAQRPSEDRIEPWL